MSPKKAAADSAPQFIGLYVPASLKAKLVEKARRQERSLAALVRLTLSREHE